LVTNPHKFTVEGVQFLGLSGQTVEDAKKYSSKTDTIEILEDNLRCSHISPTSPDSLDTYPYTDIDPFVLDKCPHVYFSSTKGAFQTKLLEETKIKVRIIAIPKFVDSKSIVLLNLRTLSCHELQIEE
jgi:DNA polymerase delta subunit 2